MKEKYVSLLYARLKPNIADETICGIIKKRKINNKNSKMLGKFVCSKLLEF